MKRYIKKKIDSQPKGFSCGSYFKNPKEKPAGIIIEELGFKDKRIGGAQVSKAHANFIINTGKATSSEIYQLAQMIKKKAKKKLGIILEEEVKYIGKFKS
jgi:UDP-N-acetylenolpyruvoylglucosamine reductase